MRCCWCLRSRAGRGRISKSEEALCLYAFFLYSVCLRCSVRLEYY